MNNSTLFKVVNATWNEQAFFVTSEDDSEEKGFRLDSLQITTNTL